MKVLCIRPRHNTPGKRDVTGAFAPEADKFLKLHGAGGIETFDNRKGMAARRREVLEILAEEADHDAIAFFCHGWSNGIQAGFTRATIVPLVTAVDEVSLVGRDTRVILYCCSTGDDPQDRSDQAAGTGDNSFADKLRDTLCEKGQWDCRVTAHDTVAHTTKNPFVLFFDGMGSSSGGAGGFYPVAPRSTLWAKWCRRMRDSKDTLRYTMPFLSVAEIHEQLQSG